MRKKLVALFLMIICLFCACGCAHVYYSDIVLSDGSIVQKIVVEIDKTELTGGLTLAQAHADIAAYAQNYYDALEVKFKLNVAGSSLTVEEQATLIGDVLGKTEFKTSTKDEILTITLTFADLATYKTFYNVKDGASSTETTDYWFYETETQQSVTEFHDLQNNAIAKQWLDYFKQSMPLVSFENCTYCYCYSTPHSQIYSDADYVVDDEYGNYSHLWIFEAKDLTGANANTGDVISIYTVGIKSPLWYFVALGATLILIGGLYLYCHIKEKKKKSSVQVEIS